MAIRRTFVSDPGNVADTPSTNDFADEPVNFVSFYDSPRFTHWLHDGQGSADTESGAYTLLGGTATPSNGSTVLRNLGADIFLPSENEWYKAACGTWAPTRDQRARRGGSTGAGTCGSGTKRS